MKNTHSKCKEAALHNLQVVISNSKDRLALSLISKSKSSAHFSQKQPHKVKHEVVWENHHTITPARAPNFDQGVKYKPTSKKLVSSVDTGTQVTTMDRHLLQKQEGLHALALEQIEGSLTLLNGLEEGMKNREALSQFQQLDADTILSRTRQVLHEKISSINHIIEALTKESRDVHNDINRLIAREKQIQNELVFWQQVQCNSWKEDHLLQVNINGIEKDRQDNAIDIANIFYDLEVVKQTLCNVQEQVIKSATLTTDLIQTFDLSSSYHTYMDEEKAILSDKILGTIAEEEPM